MSAVELSPLRVGRITGSRIGGILGLANSSYGNGTRAKVLREMVRQHHGLEPEFTGNEATAWGNLHEADALAEYEKQELQIVHSAQEIVIHPFHDFLAYTPDARVGTEGLAEAKCPWKARYESVWQRPDYEAQCRLGMECTGLLWCDFIVWRKPNRIWVSRVDYDPTWLPRVLPKLLSFMADYQLAINDPVYLAREKGRGKAAEVKKRERFLQDQARWRELQEQEAAIGEELAEVKKRVGEQLGDNEILTVDGKPAAKWQYREGSSIFDRASFKKAYAELEAEFSKTGEPTRFPVLIDQQEGEVA